MCAHSLQRSSSHISVIINHTRIHLVSRPSSGLARCFTASPATIEGWQPHSARGWRGNGRDVVSEEGEKWVSVEKESGDERQTVKQVQKKKEGESDRKKKDSHQMCSLCTHRHQCRGGNVENCCCLFMCSSCHRLFRVYLARCNLWYKDTGVKLKEKTTQSDSVQPGVDSPSAPFSPNISFICFSVDGGGEHHLKSSTASHRLSAGFRSCDSRVHSIWVTPYSYSPNHSVSLRVLWMGELLSWITSKGTRGPETTALIPTQNWIPTFDCSYCFTVWIEFGWFSWPFKQF